MGYLQLSCVCIWSTAAVAKKSVCDFHPLLGWKKCKSSEVGDCHSPKANQLTPETTLEKKKKKCRKSTVLNRGFRRFSWVGLGWPCLGCDFSAVSILYPACPKGQLTHENNTSQNKTMVGKTHFLNDIFADFSWVGLGCLCLDCDLSTVSILFLHVFLKEVRRRSVKGKPPAVKGVKPNIPHYNTGSRLAPVKIVLGDIAVGQRVKTPSPTQLLPNQFWYEHTS